MDYDKIWLILYIILECGIGDQILHDDTIFPINIYVVHGFYYGLIILISCVYENTY